MANGKVVYTVVAVVVLLAIGWACGLFSPKGGGDTQAPTTEETASTAAPGEEAAPDGAVPQEGAPSEGAAPGEEASSVAATGEVPAEIPAETPAVEAEKGQAATVSAEVEATAEQSPTEPQQQEGGEKSPSQQ